MTNIKSIILAGGVGTRLWPLSRTQYPKQFLQLSGNSLFQETYIRALKFSKPEEILVVTNEVHQFLVKNQVEEIGYHIQDQHILKEPVGKNTLPAITWAVVEIIREFGESNVVVFPSDHHLEPSACAEISDAEKLADEYLVTFGIEPTYPNTGYGYIAPGTPVSVGFEVTEFKEKPDKKTAEQYIRQGYLWNSGMFLFSTKLYVEELKQLRPDIMDFFQSDSVNYNELDSVSIDYGLLEKSKHVAVVRLKTPWTDLGTFQAWYDFNEHDSSGNVGEFDAIKSSGNFVHSPGKRTAVIGVDNTVIVDTDDALLVCNRDYSDQVGELVKKFKKQGDSIADFHRTVHRPWGTYVELETSQYFRIKRITVKPGKKLSLQMHRHRSEHWVIVSGMADVTLGEKTLFLRSGESTFVKAGTVHRLGNSGKIPLEVIEVQIGEYLGEDDIERFLDDYNRC